MHTFGEKFLDYFENIDVGRLDIFVFLNVTIPSIDNIKWIRITLDLK